MGSLWQDIIVIKKEYPALAEDLEVDVVVVGGGITGITVAKQLIDAGKIVAVIEAATIGGVTTGSSTGNLYMPVQPGYHGIESKFNIKTAKNIAYSRQIAIDYIENTIKEYNIKCKFKRRPWYAYSNDLNNTACLQEMETLQKMEIADDYNRDLPFDLPFKKAVIIPDQARFNPLQYVVNLACELHKQGCLIYEYTRVLTINETTKCTIITSKAKITARQVVIATHTPPGINSVQFYTAPYRSYVMAVTLKDDVYPEGHFWDMDNSLHLCTHAVSRQNPELLMVAGSHHKTGQSSDMQSHYKELEDFLHKQFRIDKIRYQWSAQHYHSADNIPYIGLAHSSAKYTYMATGYFADGLVYGTLAGIILGELLNDGQHEFFSIYNARRQDFWRSAPFLLKEGSNIFLEYLKDLPLFASQYQDLRKGEGKIAEIHREKYAISRDQNNKLHVVSAVCPHMQGIVSWNNAEQSWDCPLHGSRFTCTGEIIEGPAVCPLHNAGQLEGDI